MCNTHPLQGVLCRGWSLIRWSAKGWVSILFSLEMSGGYLGFHRSPRHIWPTGCNRPDHRESTTAQWWKLCWPALASCARGKGLACTSCFPDLGESLAAGTETIMSFFDILPPCLEAGLLLLQPQSTWYKRRISTRKWPTAALSTSLIQSNISWGACALISRHRLWWPSAADVSVRSSSGLHWIVILGYFRKVQNWIGIVEAYFNFPSAHFLRNSSDVLLISWGSKPLLLEIDRAHLQTSACSAPAKTDNGTCCETF